MALEFLQSEQDIEAFTAFLYENGCFLAHRSGAMRDVRLEQSDAAASLIFDLYTGWATYYIGNEKDVHLLEAQSCGPQSHPRKLGNQGRLAGIVSFCDDKKPNAAEVMRLIKRYFTQNYCFQRYNGNARMSCFFGPHYLAMEEAYRNTPDPIGWCPGVLQILCMPDDCACVQAAVQVLLTNEKIRNRRMVWRTYWENHAFMELLTTFHYHVNAFGDEDCAKIAGEIVGHSENIRRVETRLLIRLTNDASSEQLMKGKIKRYFCLHLERPWTWPSK